MDLDTTLAGVKFNKIEKPIFMDKNGKPGIAVGGHFATLEEIQYECNTNDIYIHTLEEMKSEAGAISYWMVYACRDRSIPQNALSLLKKLNVSSKIVPLGNHAELGLETPLPPTPIWP